MNTATAAPTSQIEADYFDGRHARAHRVRAHVSGSQLYLRGSGIAIAVPLAQVQWPPRGQRGARLAHFANGASLQCADGAAWDAWAEASGLKASAVSRAESSWRWVLGAVAVLVLLVGGMYVWGLPLLSRGVVALVPHSVDEKIGEVALESLPDEWLVPTQLPMDQQQRLRAAFDRAVQSAFAPGEAPAYTLRFHKSRLGPNAFALPGGHIVMTDELVTLVEGREDAIVGVLAHELGHVRHRHGMRALVQVTVLSAVSSLAFGDFSGLFAGLPVLLGHAGYSRDAEREADGESIRIMLEAGLSPEAMVVFFEKIGTWADEKAAGKGGSKGEKKGEPGKPREESALGIAFSSHPADAERIARFREAARRLPAISNTPVPPVTMSLPSGVNSWFSASGMVAMLSLSRQPASAGSSRQAAAAHSDEHKRFILQSFPLRCGVMACAI